MNTLPQHVMLEILSRLPTLSDFSTLTSASREWALVGRTPYAVLACLMEQANAKFALRADWADPGTLISIPLQYIIERFKALSHRQIDSEYIFDLDSSLYREFDRIDVVPERWKPSNRPDTLQAQAKVYQERSATGLSRTPPAYGSQAFLIQIIRLTGRMYKSEIQKESDLGIRSDYFSWLMKLNWAYSDEERKRTYALSIPFLAVNLEITGWTLEDIRPAVSWLQVEDLVEAFLLADIPNLAIITKPFIHVTVRGTLLSASMALGWSGVVNVLLKKHKVDVTVNDNEALRVACRYGLFGLAKHLIIDHGAIPPIKAQSPRSDTHGLGLPLSYAAAWGDRNMIDFLIDQTKPDESGEVLFMATSAAAHPAHCTYPLRPELQSPPPTLLTYLLDKNCALGEYKDMALFAAVNSIDIIRPILEHPAVSKFPDLANTALIFAARVWNCEVIRYLVKECGANVNHRHTLENGGTITPMSSAMINIERDGKDGFAAPDLLLELGALADDNTPFDHLFVWWFEGRPVNPLHDLADYKEKFLNYGFNVQVAGALHMPQDEAQAHQAKLNRRLDELIRSSLDELIGSSFGAFLGEPVDDDNDDDENEEGLTSESYLDDADEGEVGNNLETLHDEGEDGVNLEIQHEEQEQEQEMVESSEEGEFDEEEECDDEQDPETVDFTNLHKQLDTFGQEENRYTGIKYLLEHGFCSDLKDMEYYQRYALKWGPEYYGLWRHFMIRRGAPVYPEKRLCECPRHREQRA
ncbi:uncharacterized protein EV422DRAFT_528282 [Fimicolochytrium jonesii]|uniref:uncharacterized protein n=1 Tax=Fimicolochytrium jonesii TaxID=1396493 RepID=UPI0022FEB09B|nr:uncharacterized protein EV422DRAFT_528282 [Fimicolochytrium jonesii]KAI8821485.1 hypothetical protein EV422DRAFT_528282 [Fimicolochytrium jonesii]